MVVGVAVLGAPGVVLAGMPSWTLTDVAAVRFETISFFALVLLLCAWAVQGLWNGLRREFAWMPRLTYGRALGVVGLWGMLFLLILTMIAGARELMTPGAWEKDGAIYRLTKQDAGAERQGRMAALKELLWAYADGHGGALPADDKVAEVPARAWETTDLTRARYVYVPGRKAGLGADVVAYEPDVTRGPRLVLLSDGGIRPMTETELRAALGSGKGNDR